MKHIAQEVMADFVRQSLSAIEAASIQAHLDECAACSETADLLRKVSQIAAREASYEPPDGMIRTVKAYFGMQPEKRPQASTTFELLFDSLAQPMTQGARASVASARQLLYRVGTVYVDMRVDSELNSERAALVGQMLDSARPGSPVAGVPVILLDGRKSVASTISNNNGEFHLEFALKNNLRLSVTVGDSVPVYLPITGIEDRKRPSPATRGPN